jgi:hypothetical protein
MSRLSHRLGEGAGKVGEKLGKGRRPKPEDCTCWAFSTPDANGAGAASLADARMEREDMAEYRGGNKSGQRPRVT